MFCEDKNEIMGILSLECKSCGWVSSEYNDIDIYKNWIEQAEVLIFE